MKARTLFTAASLIAAAIAAAPAHAATSIGTFKQWGAYTSSDSNGKMCFVASQPQDSKYQPNAVSSRDPVFFMITSIPGKNIRNAPFINHTDQELALIEALVGRAPPFLFPRGTYTGPRRTY